jgi:hypothetical protein
MKKPITDLLYDLKYQHPTGITTWASCSRPHCKHPARGGATCVHCVTEDLVAHGVNVEDVTDLVGHLQSLARAAGEYDRLCHQITEKLR